jgi:hypothetical protein
MLNVERRIQKLETALGLSGRARPFVHRIVFIEGDGTITGTLVMSDDPAQRQPYRASGKESL